MTECVEQRKALIGLHTDLLQISIDGSSEGSSAHALALCTGEGEFGIVHKAKWHNTLVAAKIIKDSSSIALGDFRAELDVLRRVHHPNAVQFLGACTKEQPYIIITGTPLLEHFGISSCMTSSKGCEESRKSGPTGGI